MVSLLYTATGGLSRPFMAIFAAIDGPTGPNMAAINGLLCHELVPSVFSFLTAC